MPSETNLSSSILTFVFIASGTRRGALQTGTASWLRYILYVVFTQPIHWNSSGNKL